jgi:hypothetical protein
MKTQNLSEAVAHYGKFMVALRYANADSIRSGDPFAGMAVFGLIGPSVELENKLKLITSAAGETVSQTRNDDLLMACKRLLRACERPPSDDQALEEVAAMNQARVTIARAEKEGV